MGAFEDIKFLWHNGKTIPKNEFKLPLWTWTLHYGAGVFEGLRFYEGKDNSYIVKPEAHIKRMFDSAKIYMMKIPFTLAASYTDLGRVW